MHVFHDSLAESHAQADAPWWEEVYRRAFVGFDGMRCVRRDGWAQRGGIDRQVFLRDGTVLKIDEKVRKEAWPDIALERWSDRDREHAGWVQKPLTCDYLAYAFIPTRRCYLLPFQTLRKTWRLNGAEWIAKAEHGATSPKPPEGRHRGLDGFGLTWALNEGYTTECVTVPVAVLKLALTDAMVVEWTEV